MTKHLIATIERISAKRLPGYLEDVLRSGVVEGDWVQLSDDDYRRIADQYKKTPEPESSGPGTELKVLLSRIGITSSPTCSCNARAKTMDEKGIAWCEENVETICDWLQEEATKRKLPFVRLAGKALIHLAIRRAKKGNNK